MARYRPSREDNQRARRLRNSPTDAETRLWALLRENFRDAHFRRQVPLRAFTTDLASHRLKLVIEADGGQHALADESYRTKTIEDEGYRIIRFWNHEILGNSDGVLVVIAGAVAQAFTPPNPPHQGEG